MSSTREDTKDITAALAVVRQIDHHFDSSERLRLGKWVAPDERERALAGYIAGALRQREQEVRAEVLSIVKDAAESAVGNAFKIRDRYGDEGASGEDTEMAGCEMVRKIEWELNDASSRRDDTTQEGEGN